MSVIGLIFRFQVHQSEADATYLLSGTILVTYVTNSATDQRAPQPALLKKRKSPLTAIQND